MASKWAEQVLRLVPRSLRRRVAEVGAGTAVPWGRPSFPWMARPPPPPALALLPVEALGRGERSLESRQAGGDGPWAWDRGHGEELWPCPASGLTPTASSEGPSDALSAFLGGSQPSLCPGSFPGGRNHCHISVPAPWLSAPWCLPSPFFPTLVRTSVTAALRKRAPSRASGAFGVPSLSSVTSTSPRITTVKT